MPPMHPDHSLLRFSVSARSNPVQGLLLIFFEGDSSQLQINKLSHFFARMAITLAMLRRESE